VTAHLTFSLDAGVATIQFDNPPLQVMTPATINELNALLPRLIEPDVRAVVFGGNRASGYFIRHFSVEELDNTIRGVAIPWDRSMHDVLFDIEHLPKPVISAMDGSAMGRELEFALATDIRVAKDGPFRFGLPESPPRAVAYIKRLVRAAASRSTRTC
jgi:enoyl-CoA hydratase/carnithine racemase